MKHLKTISLAAALLISASASAESVQLLSYAFPQGKSGLRVAWRADSLSQWQPLGDNFNLVNSDFGPWGSHKKMFAPKLMRNRADGRWVCVWTPDAEGGVTAVAYSPDLCTWSPQQYFVSATDITRDICPDTPLTPDSVVINDTKVAGYIQNVDSSVIDHLSAFVADKERKAKLYAETCAGDSARYAHVKSAPNVKVTVSLDKAFPITDKLIGIFFEDINFAADGGLYAELVQNRDFEYTPRDHWGWDSMTAWSTAGNGSAEIATENPIHSNNPHYITLSSADGSLSLSNAGFDGIPVRKGAAYTLSLFARAPKKTALDVALLNPDGAVVAKTRVKVNSADWKSYKLKFKASASADNATLRITPAAGSVSLDMISLFPANTFKGRENGLRPDLAQLLADLKPRFVRFPGGCVAHGNGVDNIYDWKGSVGPLHERKPLANLWNYHQTRGLGYHEYFLFCEDIGAEPLPVLAAGVPCQNSGWSSHHSVDKVTALGQQNGIPMEEMDSYIRDVLDLIEYANGDVSTEWGAMRAAAGHPEPFNLKYVGIGNEDMITEVFEPRFKMIFDAVKAKYPEITVVGTVGPFYEGTDYDTGWQLADSLQIPVVDEHYYVDPGWLVHNRDYYDNYRRDATKVYLGEWAAHLPGRPNNIETALAEALYLTDVERNGDVVEMTSYAPLLAKNGHVNWNPDLIYFDNNNVYPTVGYHVQKLYGNNSGTLYIPSALSFDVDDKDVAKRVGVSVVKDEKSGDTILKMVNMLPMEVKVDLSGDLAVTPGEYRATVLAGTPADKEALPVETTVTLPSLTLPAYSFTVVRCR